MQDDFAPAFLLHRHGLLAALLLWCAQALLVAGLVRAAVGHGRAGAAATGFRQAWLLRLQAFALCGGAAFVAGHLLLSWGTNLAIVPVMGQPMSFLSAGGSHLLFGRRPRRNQAGSPLASRVIGTLLGALRLMLRASPVPFRFERCSLVSTHSKAP